MLTWSFWQIFLLLGLLAAFERSAGFRWLYPFQVYGRVPLFFFVAHLAVLLLLRQVLPRTSLLMTYGIWLGLLALLWGPCIWYARKKIQRPNFVTRYL